MRHRMPSPDEILEALAAQAVEYANAGAVPSFEEAIIELTNQHRFLLDLCAAEDAFGEPISFAEISGSEWWRPYQEWIRIYRRVFGAAVNKLDDAPELNRQALRVMMRLLPNSTTITPSPRVMASTTDLGPAYLHQLMNWLGNLDQSHLTEGPSSLGRTLINPGKIKTYSSALRDYVGNWESLVSFSSIAFQLDETQGDSDQEIWVKCRRAWPYIWSHLANTAYGLALTIWNDDQTGAATLYDSLIRWPKTVDHAIQSFQDSSIKRSLLTVDLLNEDWNNARDIAASHLLGRSHYLEPKSLYFDLLINAHSDLLFAMAALLLRWTERADFSTSRLPSHVAAQLISGSRELPLENRETSLSVYSFDRNVFALMRSLNISQREYSIRFTKMLDKCMRQMDNLSEVDVVPGRVFTPQTIHETSELMAEMARILIATGPQNDSRRKVSSSLIQFTSVDPELKDYDNIARRIADRYDQLSQAIEKIAPANDITLNFLSKTFNRKPHQDETLNRVRIAKAKIESHHAQVLDSLRTDETAFDEYRIAFWDEIKRLPDSMAYFDDFDIELDDLSPDAIPVSARFGGLHKGEFTSPKRMESPPKAIEYSASSFSKLINTIIWRRFRQKDRDELSTSAQAVDAEFWRRIDEVIEHVGPDPILLLRAGPETAFFFDALNKGKQEFENAQIQVDQTSRERLGYVATINHIAVCASQLEAGVALLFSSRALKKMTIQEYSSSLPELRFKFSLDAENKAPGVGTLECASEFELEWRDYRAYEIAFTPSP